MLSTRTRAILIAVCSVLLAMQSYGEVIIIRHPSKVVNGSNIQNLTCKSVNDGSALVWNEESYDSKNGFPRPCLKFGERQLDKCIHWQNLQKSNWSVAHSSQISMAPVFDYRWEGFTDYLVHGMVHVELPALQKSGTIVFSARGSRDIKLRIGEMHTFVNNSCFEINLASQIEHPGPSIKSCHTNTSRQSVESFLSHDKLQRSLINELEWRTYVIEWETGVKIEVFHDNESLVKKDISGALNFNKLFVQSDKKTRLRFHIYQYRMTNISGAHVISYPFNHSESNLDVEVLVSLCPKCQLEVHVVDANGKYLVTETINWAKDFNRYKLLFWQIARVNVTWKVNHKNPIILKIVTKIDGAGQDGVWAIGGPAIHKLEGEVRQSSRLISSDHVTDLPCQKLSYKQSEMLIVHSNSSIANINSTSLHQCLTEDTEFCNFGCNGTCKGTSICNPDGCTCAPGFMGNECDQECSPGWYGYNCQLKCECKNRVDNVCNGRYGICLSSCQKYYLPSDCTRKLGPPSIRLNKENNVILNFDLKKLNRKEKKYLRFEIKKVEDRHWKHLDVYRNPNNSDWFWSNESIADIEARKYYTVRVVINETHGEEGGFNTKNWQLTKPEFLSVTSMRSGNVILKWRHCPQSWENISLYEVRSSLLDLGSNEGEKPQSRPAAIQQFVRGKNLYEVQLDLLSSKNYTFTVKAIDMFGNSTVIDMLYVLPNEDNLENVKGLPANPETKPLGFVLPAPKNPTDDGTVNVVVKRVAICPVLKSTQRTDAVISLTFELKKGEFPACKLHYNLDYQLMVGPNDEESSFVYLWCLIILPIAIVVWIVLCILRRQHTTEPFKSESHRTEYICDPKLHYHLKGLEDNSVPSEERKLRVFENYVRRAAENGILQQQFVSLPKGMVRSCEYGNMPENKPKNRYENLIAYDETRVLLVRDSSGIFSDYINANYIQGYCKAKAYIATQAPLPNTVVDFWRMIWQEEVRIICMLVDLVENGKNMCVRYWPEVGEEENYGEIVVLTTHQRIAADYTYRTFRISKHNEKDSHIVEHLQYTGWPEEGVPMYSHSVVEYLEKLLSVPPGQGPIVVHCNSGTGRTGVIILCDICRRRLTVEGTVDVFAEAKKMFSARGNMLRSISQYVLAHLVPSQCLLMLPTKLLCADITQTNIKEMKNNIPAYMKRLAETSWMDKALRPIEPLKPISPENILKNRFQKRTPVGPSLVTLTRYPAYDDNSDYISAVTVDGVKIRKQHIASQLPMPSTLTDFWRLIIEKNVELIIILQDPDLEDPTCCDVIPRGTTVVPVPGLEVQTKMGSHSNEHYTMNKLLITDSSQKPPGTKDITAITCNNWNPIKDARPPSPKTLAEIWRASEKIHRDGPTLILCYDGLTGCGLYLALSFMLERMNVEQECDVVLAVRAVRRSRSDFVRSRWQFEYLYDAALKYKELFQNYDNWTGVVGSGQRSE